MHVSCPCNGHLVFCISFKNFFISLFSSAITTADKLYVNAKDAQLNGDEEKAYVLYMRYYYVLKGIWKDSSYKAKKVCMHICMHIHIMCLCMYISDV